MVGDSMAYQKEYDIFVAYHGSYEVGGSKQYADKLVDYLLERGIKCYYFPYSNKDIYKANIIEVMKSRLFVLVCTNKIHTDQHGKLDHAYHYELATEIDAFYALTQTGDAKTKWAKVLACGEYHKGDEGQLHELFANRTHFYYDERYDEDFETFEMLLMWAKNQLELQKTWADDQVTSEIKEVFATRAIMNQSCHFDEMIAKAKSVKAVGISNSELTARINPQAIKKCIENGGEIELLFLDPQGEYTRLREEEEELRTNRIKNITNINIETALGIKEKLGNNMDNFKLYTYDLQPRMNMIFVDDKLILQYYSNKIAGIDNPTFFLEKKDISPVYDFCLKAYETLKADKKEIGMDYGL